MLSRLALRSVKINNSCLTVIRPSSSVIESKDGQTAVMLERPKIREFPGKVRMGFIPDEWFQFFYPKTGVTGPYVFGVGFLSYLLSKEIWVLEHEFYSGVSLFAILIFIIKKFGPKVAAFLDKEIEAQDKRFTDFQEISKENLRKSVESEKTAQFQMNGQSMLYDAKRENINLQLEAAYRMRLVEIHSEVKKRLDYQLETFNVKTKLEQRHMVNWIVENVRKAITPAQEDTALKQCIVDLKALAAKA